MAKILPTLTFGSCISDLTCDKLQEIYSFPKLCTLCQWRTDQFLETKIYENAPYIPPASLGQRLKEYLDPVKGEWILEFQEKGAIDRFMDALEKGAILLTDNLMDMNIALYSNVPGCDPATKVQIRHRFQKNSDVPFFLHPSLPVAKTVQNMGEIVKYIRGKRPDISIWHLSYPFSPHQVGHGEKCEHIKSLARAVWELSPDVKIIPSLDVPPDLWKDRWHFAPVFYETLAQFIVDVENGRKEWRTLKPVMTFSDFMSYVEEGSRIGKIFTALKSLCHV